jgi:hypothetical protein
MKTALAIFGIIVLLIVLTVLGFVCHVTGKASELAHGAIDNAGVVVKRELYPEALLRKYEWFKNASAELDKKQADISIYTNKIKAMREEYKGEKRSAWDRTDKESMNIWEQELAGIRASYNGLAAEYNAQHSKMNWAFCDIGKCPPGSTNPLPRTYKPYEE